MGLIRPTVLILAIMIIACLYRAAGVKGTHARDLDSLFLNFLNLFKLSKQLRKKTVRKRTVMKTTLNLIPRCFHNCAFLDRFEHFRRKSGVKLRIRQKR
jgi:hypothetical protein